MGRLLRWGGAIVCLALVLVLLAYGFLRGGAPRLDGEVALKGLSAPVQVTRDALGVPSIKASSRLDAIRALGFLHAQDRFFQMDLMRRLAAGELSELVGPVAVDFDERHRLFRLRAVARQVLTEATPTQRAAIVAYTEGVNAGLKALGTWPFEYGLLMRRPRPWAPEDCILVIDAMYFDLQSAEDRRESQLALMRETLPPALFRFLSAPGTQWDAPIVGKPMETPPFPGADVVDLRKRPSVMASTTVETVDAGFADIGSNNWAVSKEHGIGGRALLANDMHLGIKVPNTWYRAQWTYRDDSMPERSVTLTGATLPGVPAMVVGSNGHVAWGFTNSYGDWSDLVLLRINPSDSDEYRTAEGWRHFEHHRELIRVKGGKDVTFEVRDTLWGPVLDQDHDGTWRAVHWMGAQADGTNLELGDMDHARNIQESMAVANRAGMPEQNFMTADADGHIAWTIAGRIPVRHGYDPQVPSYWDKPDTGWTGWLPPEKYPRVVDPADGRLWTANARVVEGPMLALIGDGGYDLGARAGQIRDDLHKQEQFAPKDFLAIQLDDQARFLARWRSLLLRFLTPQRLLNHPERIAFRDALERWDDRAAVDSVAYRLVREFRGEVEDLALAPLFAPCKQADPKFDFHSLSQLEGPLWALVNQQPGNLLDPAYKTWDVLMLRALDRVTARMAADKSPAGYTWGERNTVRLRHPLSAALPFLSRFLDMAPVELPGDSNMPRVQGVDFGASERMVVSPGHEEDGIFEMPTGQSGWPLSPFYRNSEPAWERGDATPFLPGQAQYMLVLKPKD
ncbi:MAG TPA: penicillin acylase family protein [Gammaproteobacteria bacterium]|nr:penicillin acylase family protein [Gammaproteobacteria bacterium]